jgi:hypothetical protein
MVFFFFNPEIVAVWLGLSRWIQKMPALLKFSAKNRV